MREYRRRRRETLEGPRAALPDLLPDGADPHTALIDYAERSLVVPTGFLAGKPFHIEPWQRDFLAGAMAPDTRLAALTCARKNGKTGLIAALILAHAIGPNRKRNFSCGVVSLTQRQSAVLLTQISQIAEISGVAHLIEPRRQPLLMRAPGGTQVEFLSADKRVGHGASFDLVVVDELGLTDDKFRPTYDSMSSAISAKPGGRLIAISVRGTSPIFDELLDMGHEPGVFTRVYAAEPDCRLDDPVAWESGNPGLDTIKSREYMEFEARRAMANPASEAAFRALDLNAAVDHAESALTVSQWRACECEPDAVRPQGPAFLGLDLGMSRSMSSVSVYYPATGALLCHSFLPLNGRAFQEVAVEQSAAGVYEDAARRGELTVVEGSYVAVEDVLAKAYELLGGRPPAGIQSDSWRSDELKAKLPHGWPEPVFRNSSHTKLQTVDFSHFRDAAVEARIRCSSKLLPLAIRNARVKLSGSGVLSIVKRAENLRIDALMAAIQSVSVAAYIGYQPQTRIRLVGARVGGRYGYAQI